MNQKQFLNVQFLQKTRPFFMHFFLKKEGLENAKKISKM